MGVLSHSFLLQHATQRLKLDYWVGSPAYAQNRANSVLLPEFVSYLVERGVMCVENGWHFCTPVLINMSNIKFQVLRLSTFVFNKCSEIIIFTIIFLVKCLKGFGWNNAGPASQTVAQHYISIRPMSRVIWCFWCRDFQGHQHNAAVRNTVQSPNSVSMKVERRRLWVNIETVLVWCHVFAQSIQQTRW